MIPRAEREVLVDHTSGAAAYVVYLQGLKRTVTSSAVTFDDIPREIPFLTGHPDHWTSPVPGVDDTTSVIEEETAMEVSYTSADWVQERHSNFDGRDIPRPRVTVHRVCQRPEEAEEDVTRAVPNQEPEKTIIRAAPDQLEMLSNSDDMHNAPESPPEENRFIHCMLADTSITMEAMTGPEAGQWQEAIESEDRGLEELKVITMEECPEGVKPLNTRYVVSKKKDSNGMKERYKARRVMQGFHQVYGRGFLDTFAPVVGFDTLRTLLKLMVNRGWNMKTMDFTQAYLAAPLKRDPFM